MTKPPKPSPKSNDSIKSDQEKGWSGNPTASNSDPPDNRFPKWMRLSGREAFNNVFDRGQVLSDATLVIHAIANGIGFTRMGISISKKVGKAPTRNYWKRCIREAFRCQKDRIPCGLDIIVRPRRGAIANPTAIAASMVTLLQRTTRSKRNR